MALAVNRLGEVGGGVAVYSEGQELALVELPIAGLMSAERAEVVAEKAARMVQAFRDCGCPSTMPLCSECGDPELGRGCTSLRLCRWL